MAGTVSGGAPRARKQPGTSLEVKRPQALNEDLSDCAEGWGRASVSRLLIAPVVGVRKAPGKECSPSAAERVGAGRERQATRSGLCQCLSAWEERASSEGTRIGIKRPGARLRAVVGVCAIASVAVALKAHRRSVEGPVLARSVGPESRPGA
jgi:hypothetical protein